MSPSGPIIPLGKHEVLKDCVDVVQSATHVTHVEDKMEDRTSAMSGTAGCELENDAADANVLGRTAATASDESSADSEINDEHGAPLLMDDCDHPHERKDIPTALRQQATWLDPFPTPTNSIGTNMSSRSLNSPFHQRHSGVDVFNPESFNSPQSTPRSSLCINSSWNDPFPTPDVSMHNSKRDSFLSSGSQRNVNDGDLNNFEPPPLPCIEEPKHEKRRSFLGMISPNHKSAPSLSNSHLSPIRRISSEAGSYRCVPSLNDCVEHLSDDRSDNNNEVTREKQHLNEEIMQSTRHNSLRKSRSKDDFSIGLKPNKSQEESTGKFNRKQSKDDLDLLTNATIATYTNTFSNTHLPPLLTPVRNLLAAQSRRASNAYRVNSQRIKIKLRERREKRRQRREMMAKIPPRSWWIIIPADHPYKITWDVLTMIWALLGAYRTHLRIRDRVFDQSPLILLTEVWFTLDILLNFVTEHKTSKGKVIRDGKTVWARYLTTWFVIDLLSLIPWERIYVRPVVEKIKKRNFFQKTFFRSKAVVRVSRVLRGRHVKLIGQVSKQTGTPLRRFVALLIKYVPKYLLFFRHMKGALFVRLLRFVHWLHNMYKKIWVSAQNAGRSARKTMSFRGNTRHPIFELNPYRVDHEDVKDEDDHSDTDGDHGTDDEDFSHFDINEMTSMDMSDIGDEYDQVFSHSYRRSQSEMGGAFRRRTFSEM